MSDLDVRSRPRGRPDHGAAAGQGLPILVPEEDPSVVVGGSRDTTSAGAVDPQPVLRPCFERLQRFEEKSVEYDTRRLIAMVSDVLFEQGKSRSGTLCRGRLRAFYYAATLIPAA